jgi:hypothetical protein
MIKTRSGSVSGISEAMVLAWIEQAKKHHEG